MGARYLPRRASFRCRVFWESEGERHIARWCNCVRSEVEMCIENDAEEFISAIPELRRSHPGEERLRVTLKKNDIGWCRMGRGWVYLHEWDRQGLIPGLLIHIRGMITYVGSSCPVPVNRWCSREIVSIGRSERSLLRICWHNDWRGRVQWRNFAEHFYNVTEE